MFSDIEVLGLEFIRLKLMMWANVIEIHFMVWNLHITGAWHHATGHGSSCCTVSQTLSYLLVLSREEGNTIPLEDMYSLIP